MGLIPEKLINFRVYGGVGAAELLGLATVELPKFEAMTETIAGAGIAGEIDSPVLGHFKSATVKLNLRTMTAQALALLAGGVQVLDIRQSVQVQDTALGAMVTDPHRLEVRGLVKVLDPGKLEPGKMQDANVEIEAQYLKLSNAGVPVVELDKLNMIFRVGSTDYLRQVRADLGGV